MVFIRNNDVEKTKIIIFLFTKKKKKHRIWQYFCGSLHFLRPLCREGWAFDGDKLIAGFNWFIVMWIIC